MGKLPITPRLYQNISTSTGASSMKKLIALFLTALVLIGSPNLELRPARAQAAPIVLMVAAVLAGCIVTLYVWKTNTAQKLRWLVLCDDDLAGHLTPIATNQVFVGPNLTLAFPAFQIIITNQEPKGFWRIVEIPTPSNNFVPQYIQKSAKGVVVLCP
jgi:hypothetical protein